MKRINKLNLFALVTVLVVALSPATVPANILEETSSAQAEIYERVAPSVVRIATKKAMEEIGSMESMPDIPLPFRRFMDPHRGGQSPFDFYFQVPQSYEPESREVTPGLLSARMAGPNKVFQGGVGSGTIVRVDERGAWILTNNHVIDEADSVTIEFFDEVAINDFVLISGEDDPDRNAYLDWRSDLALILLDPRTLEDRKLRPATLGDSDALRVGEVAFTLGAPLNREWTFSQGIISAMDRGNFYRNKKPEIRYEGFIQTTAFINVGNSGGPLLNAKGEVTGINVAIQTAGGIGGGGFIGLGFAIPSNRARRVVDEFITHGEVVRGYLGVAIEPPDADTSKYLNLPPRTGVAVIEVYPDTPAEKGGIKKKDIILAFEGSEVHSTTHLQKLVALAPVGEQADVEVLRGGEKLTLKVPIERLMDEETVAESGGGGRVEELGAGLRAPKKDESEYYEGVEGVIVSSRDDQGPLGGSKNIPEGSLVTAIEGQKVTSLEEVRDVIAKVIELKGNKGEVRVMVTYVPPSSDNTEEFQVIKLKVDRE